MSIIQYSSAVFMQNSQVYKKGVAFNSLGEKSCEIKAAMMLVIINFDNA